MLLFERFLRNRRGSVTIMLTFLLLTVMSMGTTLTEVARYRTLERMYKEISNNASFSVLSHYDRDLFENYGLLGLDPSIGKEEYIYYLQENLNGSIAERNSIDSLVNVSENYIDFQKLYDLGQYEVFESQINEFSAYRVPVNFALELVNLEERFGDLREQLEVATKILEFYKALADTVTGMIEVYTAFCEYNDKCDDLVEKKDNYWKAVNEYNAAIEARDQFKDNYNAMQANVGEAQSYQGVNATESNEDYQQKLAQKNAAIDTAASNLSNQIVALEKSLIEQYDSYKKIREKVPGTLNNIKETITSGKAADIATSMKGEEKKAAEENLEAAKKAYEATYTLSDKIVTGLEGFTQNMVNTTRDNLRKQMETVTTIEGDTAKKIKDVPIVGADYVSTCMSIAFDVINEVEKLMKDCWEILSKIKTMLESFDDLSNAQMIDPHYNNVIIPQVSSQLSGHQKNGDTMMSVSNPYSGRDADLKDKKIEETRAVANVLDFPINELRESDAATLGTSLENAMERHRLAKDALMASIRKVNAFTILVNTLNIISDIVQKLVEYIDSLVDLAGKLITVISTGIFNVLLDKFAAAKYATTMFSSRATDFSKDKKLNGSDFNNYSQMLTIDTEVFDKANVEYILAGSAIEATNQSTAFTLMFILRLLCNVPLVFKNQLLNNLCKEVISTTLVTVVRIVWVILESQADMVILTSGKEVELIKQSGHFEISADVNEMENKVTVILESVESIKKRREEEVKKEAEMAKNQNKASKKDTQEEDKKEDKKEESNKSETKDFLKVTYEDHLFLFLLLFVSNEKICSRCADLIDMDMRLVKWYGGEDKEFKLGDMATYVRVDSIAEYAPVLPIIVPELQLTETENEFGIPSLENKLKIRDSHYNGY